MNRDELSKQLAKWVALHEQNGIKQHDQRWKDEKVLTIGGSSLATIMGLNPYSTIPKMISEKIGLTNFNGDIKPQWGNLFEDVIKRHVEKERNCVILGEDLFIKGPPAYPHTSYSPDGLTVIDVVEKTVSKQEKIINGELIVEFHTSEKVTTEIALVEFKCPFSRLPNGTPPAYYIPQVKMGLQLLDLPTTGLFIEGVFRRCSWPVLGYNSECDTTLVPRKLGNLPKSYGIIGFYATTPDLPFKTAYIDNYVEFGDESNGFICNDLGNCSPELFTSIMDAYDKKLIQPWYGKICMGGSREYMTDFDEFVKFCTDRNYTVVGMIPWKLFHIDYHYIKKEDRYIDEWIPKIVEVIGVVNECNKLQPEQKARRYAEYLMAQANDRFV